MLQVFRITRSGRFRQDVSKLERGFVRHLCLLHGQSRVSAACLISRPHSLIQKDSTSAATRSPLNVRLYASKKRGAKPQDHAAEPVAPAYIDDLLRLRNALDTHDVETAMQAYGTVKSSAPLGPADAGALARLLPYVLRKSSKGKPDSNKIHSKLLAHAEELVNDIRHGVLVPSHTAHLHLLTFFKDARHFQQGHIFWNWLVRQDDTFVNSAVYGAAIELLAVEGRPADDTEATYHAALKRFPGNFSEYHLSPNAMVADSSISSTTTGGSLTLLQGIITARLLQGNAKDAYLALDTALRLHPDRLRSSFVSVFVNERPVMEAYKVFVIACRAGVVVGSEVFKALLQRFSAAARSDRLDCHRHGFAARAMLTLAHTYISIGGSVTSNHLTELVVGIAAIVPKFAKVHRQGSETQAFAQSVYRCLRNLLDAFSNHGIQPSMAAFNTMIATIAGPSGSASLVQSLFVDAGASGCAPTLVTYRCLVKAAGDLQDSEMLRAAWTDLREFCEASGTPATFFDWKMLAKAATKANDTSFVEQQIGSASHAMTESLASSIRQNLGAVSSAAKLSNQSSGYAEKDIREMESTLNAINADIAALSARMDDASIQNCVQHPLLMSVEQAGNGSDRSPPSDDVRALYDEMNEISTQPVTDLFPDLAERGDQVTAPVLSTTGFTLKELRFQNWQTINELLAEAEAHDAVYSSAVDTAMRNGTVPPNRGKMWDDAFAETCARMSDKAVKASDQLQVGDSMPTEVQDWYHKSRQRRDILRLRTPGQ